jgi:hypothetical protein
MVVGPKGEYMDNLIKMLGETLRPDLMKDETIAKIGKFLKISSEDVNLKDKMKESYDSLEEIRQKRLETAIQNAIE